MRIESARVDSLRRFELPVWLLPLAPRRQLFLAYAQSAIIEAANLSERFPEKRGTLSRAVAGLPDSVRNTVPYADLTIEAHVDGRDFSQPLLDDLLTLGFEPDGFANYHPRHFNAHGTLKFRTNVADGERRKAIFSLVRSHCALAAEALARHGVEAYVELEIYPEKQRASWSEQAPSNDWYSCFPVPAGAMRQISLEAEQNPTQSTSLRKGADIHVKLARLDHADKHDRRKTISHFDQSGFYHVRTWGGNDICTAEFVQVRDAMRIFKMLKRFFDAHGGASEMTLERVVSLARSTYVSNGIPKVAAVPPLTVALDFDFKD